MSLHFEIRSLAAIKRDLQQPFDGYVISIRDTVWVDEPKPHPLESLRDNCQGMLAIYFDDICADIAGMSKPEWFHVATILEWAWGKNRFMIHCFEGKHRSAAAAYLIACTRMSPDYALGYLTPPIHTPNGLMVEHGAALLDEPRVLSAFQDYMAACR